MDQYGYSKKELENKIIYIKLKIETNNNEQKLKCLSFHEDELD